MKLFKPTSLQKGYTFIELLIVFSIMGIIGVGGIAAFVTFNNNQSLEGAASDVANVYTTARQRAFSQVKPIECTDTQSLRAYRVVINITNSTYQADALCGSLIVPVVRKRLPNQVSFDASSPTTVTFSLPNATVGSTALVTLNGYGKTKVVRIDGTGTISVQ